MPNNLLPSLHPIDGIRLAAAEAGIRYRGRSDLAVIEIADGARSTAVFTRNAFCAAPVTVAKRHLVAAAPRYLLLNSGNANAGLGAAGVDDALACCSILAAQTGCEREAILPFSTGVIGERLSVDAFRRAIPDIVPRLDAAGWLDAARAIMTTDTVPKCATSRVVSSGKSFTVTGIAKGAGMIRPDMATMLAFVATDAAVAPAVLERCLRDAVAQSFNRITVDGDTSTNDACVLIATGRSAFSVDDLEAESYRDLSRAVTEVCTSLAQALVRDAEGATKFITVRVGGGRDSAECLQVAYTIAHSPLVKTAFFASDPNWGRILAALGRAGVPDLDVRKVGIYLDDVCIVSEGGAAPDYTEARGAAVMAQPEITVRIDLGRGDHAETVWTSDLSVDYVKINAEYRT